MVCVGWERAFMTSQPCRITIRWSVPPGEARPITSTLQGLMASTRTEPGSTGCSLTTEMGAQVAINYVEDWKTEGDLKRQLRSDRFAALAELMEQASEHPTIEFALAGSTRGLDYAREVRGT